MSQTSPLSAHIAGTFAVLLTGSASAATIGYWRMEADNDPGPGLEILNEIAGGTPMFSTNAQLDLDVPANPIQQTGASNTTSVFRVTGGGANGINGTIAQYAALDSDSITIEFFGRTTEGEASPFNRGTGAARNAHGTDGVSMFGTNSLSVRYVVNTGGAGTQVNWTNLHNFDNNWDHVAFTYDAPTGVGSFYVDGVQVATNDGPDGVGILWPAAAVNANVGQGLDSGEIDELRISDVALVPTQFLNVPEPSAVLLGLVGLGFAALRRRR